MLREIDPRKLRDDDLKLVGFGTRNTLSAQDDPVRGIGAARDWIKSQLDEIAATSGGRMTVALDSFIQPVASRIPVPTPITNVVATLHSATRSRPRARTSCPATTTRSPRTPQTPFATRRGPMTTRRARSR